MNPTDKKARKVVSRPTPAAPPVYRPQQPPLVLQRKTATAPPVYKPKPPAHSTPNLPTANKPVRGAALQAKSSPPAHSPRATVQPAAARQANTRPPVAPPRVNQRPAVLQRTAIRAGSARPGAVIQRMDDPSITQHLVGRAPSSRNQQPRHHFSQQKVARQKQMTHIDIGFIPDDELNRIVGSEDPTAVNMRVFVDNELRDPKPSAEFAELLQHPAQKHIEHVVSNEDAEVMPLSSALAHFEADMIDSEGRQAILHRLALIGPYGACDGCKDRLRLFKNLWREMARQYRPGLATNLVVTYFYHKVSVEHRKVTNIDMAIKAGKPFNKKKLPKVEVFRQEGTLYGWDESGELPHQIPNPSTKKGAKKFLNEKIRFRSYNASGLDQPSEKPNLFQGQIDVWKGLRGL